MRKLPQKLWICFNLSENESSLLFCRDFRAVKCSISLEITLKLTRFLNQHHRKAILHRICHASGLADQLPRLRIIFQRPTRHRAHQYVEQPGIKCSRWPITHCKVARPSSPSCRPKKFSNWMMSSARLDSPSISSSACFDAGSKGAIWAMPLTKDMSSSRPMLSQST